MEKNSKIYVAGHLGMVGSAIVRRLREEGFSNIIGRPIDELNLSNQKAVIDFFDVEMPEYVIIAAAKVGGIMANDTFRAQFIYENLMIQNNIIHQSYLHGVKKLLFLGSSCIYPRDSRQPIKEEYLLTGPLEFTNEPYAIAKIAGIKMCENYYRQYECNFISVMPTNLYGPNDNYNLATSHVLPALIRKMHLGRCLETSNWVELRRDLNKLPIEGINGSSDDKTVLQILKKYGVCLDQENGKNTISVTIWGTGNVYRELMHVDDMARACVKIMDEMNVQDNFFINIGTGTDQTISELASITKRTIGFRGLLKFDHTKADGTFKKLLDIKKLKKLGFVPNYGLEEGITHVYNDFISF